MIQQKQVTQENKPSTASKTGTTTLVTECWCHSIHSSKKSSQSNSENCSDLIKNSFVTWQMINNIICFCNIGSVQLSVPVKCEQLSTLLLTVDNIQGKLRCVSGKGEPKFQVLHSSYLLLNHPEWGSDRITGHPKWFRWNGNLWLCYKTNHRPLLATLKS